MKDLSRVLEDNGVLCVNVVSRSAKAFEGAAASLKAVFPTLFSIQAEDDVNKVVLGLKGKVSEGGTSLAKEAAAFLRQTQKSRAHQEDLLSCIQKDLVRL